MNKLKIFASVAIATIVGINGYIAFVDSLISTSDLNVADVEQLLTLQSQSLGME